MPANVLWVVIYMVMIFISFKLLIVQWPRRKQSSANYDVEVFIIRCH